MNNEIRFTIGSYFSGEGFKKAEQAIKQNNKEIQSSVRGLGELSNAFANVSPEAAKAVGVAKQFGQAFVSGGIVGGVIALALKGVSEAVFFCSEKLKEAKERAEQYAKVMRENVVAAIGQSSRSFQELREEMAKSKTEADDLLAVLNGNAAAEAANKTHQARMDMLENLDKAIDENTKEIIRAIGNYKIALIESEKKQKQADNAVDAYREKLKSAGKVKEAAAERVSKTDGKLAELNEQCCEYLGKRKQIENYLETEQNRLANKEISLQEAEQARRDVAVKLRQLEEEYKGDVELLLKASQDAASAKRDAEIADRDFNRANHDLTAAIRRQTEAANAAAESEKLCQINIKQAQDKAAKAKDALAKNELEMADSWHEFLNYKIRKLDDATEGLADIMNETGNGLEDWIESIEKENKENVNNTVPVKVKNYKDIGSSFSSSFRNVVNLGEIRGDIVKPKKLDDDTFNRIKDGTANVADFQRFNRFLETEESHGTESIRRIGSDAVRFLQNADKPISWLSERDLKFQEDFKTKVLPQLPIDLAEKLLGDASKHLLSSESMKEIMKDKTVIKAWLENLGLK